MKRTLAIHMDLDDNYVEQIKELVPDWEIHVGKELSDDILKRAEVLFNWQKDKEDTYLDSDYLKWVQTFSAGVDALNLKGIAQNDITLTSANGVHSYPISETIFSYILSFTRELHTYSKSQQKKEWLKVSPEGEMHDKTIGIIGVGQIGQETAKIAKAFNMKVIGVRHSGKSVAKVDEMYTPDQLNEVLPQCDYVVAVLPLTDETHHLIGREQFKLMKETAFLVNVGRGPVVEEAALIEALENHEIAGAGLDVFENEPLDSSSPLWDMDNVILTPHTAGGTKYYNQRVVENIFIPNLEYYLNEETPSINLYSQERGY